MPILKLMSHQQTAVEEMRRRDFLALFYETGTGKTPIGLRVFEEWLVAGMERIIACVPNSLTGTWVAEADKFEFAGRIVRLPAGGDKRRALIHSGDWDVLVCNYESLKTLIEDIIEIEPGGLLLDEMQRLKNRRSVQAKCVKLIARAVKENGGKIIGLTGTPVIHSPRDLWSQFDILWPGDRPTEHVLGFGNYWAFEQSVSVVRPHPRLRKVKQYEYPPERLEMLKRRVARYAIEATKADCLDLPGRILPPARIVVDMSPEQRRVYDALKNDMVAFLDRRPVDNRSADILRNIGITSLEVRNDFDPSFLEVLGNDSATVSVNMATTLLLRLQQIAAGYAKADDGSFVELPNIKADTMMDLLPTWTEADHKSIIFSRFRYDVEVLKKICTNLGIKYVTLTGDNSRDAAVVVQQFQTDPETKVFIGNLQVASLGITLTAADFCIFYTNTFSLGDRLQALDRPYRIGQTRKVTYYDIVARQSVDESIIENQEIKQNLATLTVTNLKGLLR